MRFFDEGVREGEEREKWIPEKMPQGFDAVREGGERGKETKDVIEQKQDGSNVVNAVERECTVTPFLQDFLTRKS